MYVLDSQMARRVEAAEAGAWACLLEALADSPGNPYGAEVRRFGSVVALAVPGMPLGSLSNRIMLSGPGSEEELDAAVAFLRERGVPVRIDVSPHQQNEAFLRHLAQRGFINTGFQVALYGDPVCIKTGAAPGVTIDHPETAEDRDWLAGMYLRAFDLRGEQWERWLGNEMRALVGRPGWQTYIARVDGQRAGAAMLHVNGPTATLWMAGTLPEFRGRGAQSALIARRAADAVAAGCDLIVGQTGNGTVSQCNMERAGMRIAYTKTEYREA
jgi:GNAT superfamily N-acetyltransferase